MLRTQILSPKVTTREAKPNDDADTTTTPVHAIRATEPARSHPAITRTAKAERKSRDWEHEEKPSWPDVSTADEPFGLHMPQADGDLEMLAPQKKLRGHDNSEVMMRPSDDDGRAYASVMQIDTLQTSMIDMKTELNEAINMTGAVQQSRIDALEASLDAKLEAQNEHLSDLKQMMRRLEQMMECSRPDSSGTAAR